MRWKITAVFLLLGSASQARDESTARNDAIREWMQSYAEDTTVRVGSGDGAELVDMVKQPVFRYSDELRSIPDATLWMWTKDGRAVAFQKVEVDARPGEAKQWTTCFASLSERLIEVQWPPRPVRRTYRSKTAGVQFAPIPDADAPATAARLRTIQMKRLAQRFEGRLDLWEGGESVIRIIPTPIFEYRDAATDLPTGAIFGLTATGTNPDVLLLVEARKDAEGQPRWQYASARMTTAGVKLLLDGDAVSETPRVPFFGSENVFENWVFHFLPRELEVSSDGS